MQASCLDHLVREGVSITQILFNFPYAHAHSARLASFYCNGRPRARTPIIITIITTNVHANTKNSSLLRMYGC